MAFHFLGVRVHHLICGVGLVSEIQVVAQTRKHELDFTLRCAVKAATQGRKEPDNHGVWIGLDRVERFNLWQQLLPLVVLLDNCGQVRDEERAFLGANLDLVVDQVGHRAERGQVENRGAQILRKLGVGARARKF